MSFQTIRRTVIASGIALGAVAAAFSPAAFAATDNDTQSGSIAPIESVNYTPAGVLTIVPNTLQADTNFGSVNVQSNANGGWTLEVASTNGSILQNGSIADIAYTLKVAGNTVDVSAAGTPDIAKDVSVLTAAATGGANYAVLGSIAAADSNGKPHGTYSDTLTFTLTNK